MRKIREDEGYQGDGCSGDCCCGRHDGFCRDVFVSIFCSSRFVHFASGAQSHVLACNGFVFVVK